MSDKNMILPLGFAMPFFLQNIIIFLLDFI